MYCWQTMYECGMRAVLVNTTQSWFDIWSEGPPVAFHIVPRYFMNHQCEILMAIPMLLKFPVIQHGNGTSPIYRTCSHSKPSVVEMCQLDMFHYRRVCFSIFNQAQERRGAPSSDRTAESGRGDRGSFLAWILWRFILV